MVETLLILILLSGFLLTVKSHLFQQKQALEKYHFHGGSNVHSRTN